MAKIFQPSVKSRISHYFRLISVLAIVLFLCLTACSPQGKAERLIKKMDDASSSEKREIADQLIEIGEPAIEPILDVYRTGFTLETMHNRDYLSVVLRALWNEDIADALIQILQRRISYSDFSAAELLAEKQEVKAFDTLIEYQNDLPRSSGGMHEKIITSLTKMDTPEKYPSLAEFLSTYDSETAEYAIAKDYIIEHSEQFLTFLLEALLNLNKEANVPFATYILAEDLSCAGVEKTYKQNCSNVLQILLSTGEKVLPVITSQISEDNVNNNAIIFSLLWNIHGSQVLDDFQKSFDKENLSVATPVLLGLSSIYEQDPSDPELSNFINDHVDDLSYLFNNSDEDQRAAIGLLLSLSPQQEAVDLLYSSIDSDDVQLRKAALYSLSEYDDPRAYDALVEALRKDPEIDLEFLKERFASIDANPFQVFIDDLDSDDDDVKKNAISMMGNLGDPESVPFLVPLLSESASDIQLKVISALVQIGDSNATGSILPLMKDKNTRVRESAIDAVGKLGDQTVIPELEQVYEISSRDDQFLIISAIGNIGSAEGIKNLIQFYFDADVEMREFILDTAPIIGGSQAADFITMVVFQSEDAAQYIEDLINTQPDIYEQLIEENPALFIIEEDGALRTHAYNLLFQFPQEDLEFLNQKLKDVMEVVEKLNSSTNNSDEEFQQTVERISFDQLRWLARAYKYFLKVGIPNSEEALIWALDMYGNKTMAVNYLNCGNEMLEKAAKQWAKDHNYLIIPQPSFSSSGGPIWGSEN